MATLPAAPGPTLPPPPMAMPTAPMPAAPPSAFRPAIPTAPSKGALSSPPAKKSKVPKWLENPWVIAGLVLATLVVLTLLSKLATGVRQPVAHETIQQSDVFLRAANRWAATAQQDGNPIMALRHIGAAKTYVEALRGVLNDAQIRKAHNVDMQALTQKMDDIEQGVLRRIAEVAPDLMPEGEFAARTGWLA